MTHPSIPVAVLGASGYTGGELIRLLQMHPRFRIAHAAAHSRAGSRLQEALPGVRGEAGGLILSPLEAPLPAEVELVFTALPHGTAAIRVKEMLAAGRKVVDLSADFRYRNEEVYKQAYELEHPCPELLSEAVFGLSEHARQAVSEARLVANPGCYPTSTLLPLLPLLKADVVDESRIIVDSKSGASGAGRGMKPELLYCELNEGVRAYGLPRHRHASEMEAGADLFCGRRIDVHFVPHILPMTRGMLTTLHLCGRNPGDWHRILREAYRNEAFVRILPEGSLPSTSFVRGSNRCDIALEVTGEDRAVVISCLDNLVKGAAGQALQNANIMFGLEETLALPQTAIWP